MAVGVGMAAMVAAAPAATVAATSGVGAVVAVGGGKVGVDVGAGVGLAVQARSAAVNAKMGKAIRRIKADKSEPPASYRGYRRAC